MSPAWHQHLFYPPPTQWGLRGDPYLWRELARACATLPLPASPAELVDLLTTLYHKLVGEAPAPGRHPFVTRYQGGGMSSGHVDADFWLQQGFPLLRERLSQSLATSGHNRPD